MENTQYVVKHDPHARGGDRLIFTGTPEQCRKCLTAMMSVAKSTEHEGDGFWCEGIDGFRVKFEIRDSKPVVEKVSRTYL